MLARIACQQQLQITNNNFLFFLCASVPLCENSRNRLFIQVEIKGEMKWILPLILWEKKTKLDVSF